MSGLPRGGRSGGGGGGHSQSPPGHSPYRPGYGVMGGLPPPALPPYGLPPPGWASYAAAGHHYPPSGQSRPSGMLGAPYPPSGRIPPGFYPPNSHSAAAAAAAAAVAARGYPWYGRSLGSGGGVHLPMEAGPSRPTEPSATSPPLSEEGAPGTRPPNAHKPPPPNPAKPGVAQSDLWLLEHLASCYDVKYELVESVRASLFAHCPDAELPAWAEARVLLRRLYAVVSNGDNDQHASTLEVCLSRLDQLAEGDELPERCRSTIRVPPTLLADAKTYAVFSSIRWNGTSQKLLAGDRESRRVVQRAIEKFFSTGDCDMPDVESRSLDLRALLYRPTELVQAINSFSVPQLERDVLKYHDNCTRSLGPTLLEYVEQDMRGCQPRSFEALTNGGGDWVAPRPQGEEAPEQRERSRSRARQGSQQAQLRPEPHTRPRGPSQQPQADVPDRQPKLEQELRDREDNDQLAGRGADEGHQQQEPIAVANAQQGREAPEEVLPPPRKSAKTTVPVAGRQRAAEEPTTGLARRVSGSGLRSRLASGGTPMRLPGGNLLRHTKKRAHE